jgi:hypothetical protein
VGTGYILIEKARGVSVKSSWHDLTQHKIGKLAHSFVQMEAKLSGIPFAVRGSLYFKQDIPSNLQAPLYKGKSNVSDNQFCIGPITDYMFWLGRRATKRYGKPKETGFPHNTMGLGAQKPEEYVELLESYQSLTPHLLPKDPLHSFNQPVLRHPDATPSNVYIDSETGHITCLIDWQHAIVQPQLLAAGYPRAFESPDDNSPRDLTLPQLPDNLADLPAPEQYAARQFHRRQLLFHFYRGFNLEIQ